MINIDDLTLRQLREIAKLLPIQSSNADSALLIGQPYFIRTVTFHYTGRLVRITPTELVLEEAAWIADSGRFADALATGDFQEIEPFPDGVDVILNRGAIVDASIWCHLLPRSQR